jgi:hypothetical protein
VILDPRSGKTLCDFKNKERAGKDGADPKFSACGEYLVDGTWDGELLVHEVKKGKVVFQQQVEGISCILSINHGKQWLIIHRPKTRAGENWPPPAYMTVWNWPFGKQKPKRLKPEFARGAASAAATADGTYLAVDVYRVDDNFVIVDLKKEKVVKSSTVEFASSNKKLNWSNDSKWLGTVEDDKFVVYKAGKFGIAAEYPLRGATQVAFSPRKDCIGLGSDTAAYIVPWNTVFKS